MSLQGQTGIFNVIESMDCQDLIVKLTREFLLEYTTEPQQRNRKIKIKQILGAQKRSGRNKRKQNKNKEHEFPHGLVDAVFFI